MIKILIMDVDGTLTDGKIYIGLSGEVMKAFNVKDGLGIAKLSTNGIIPVIITGRSSEIVTNRAKELNIVEVHQGIYNKIEELQKIIGKYNCTYENLAYIGDDENDLECMLLCGMTGCPADAAEVIKGKADFVSSYKGGDGAVRDFIQYILNANEYA